MREIIESFPLCVSAFQSCCFFFTIASLCGETISLTPVTDTSLSETSQDNNFGANGNFISGTGANGLRNRAVLQFNIAGTIPAGAIITSADLGLKLSAAGTGPGSTFVIHRVLQAWGEGNKTGNGGALATSGEATWKARFFPNTLWSAPGATAPTDFSASASASKFMSSVGNYQFGSTAKSIADVQSWLENPTANFGWILISQSESLAGTSRRFASREDLLNAPMLNVTYTIPEPKVMALTILGGMIFLLKISFRIQLGKLKSKSV